MLKTATSTQILRHFDESGRGFIYLKSSPPPDELIRF